MKVFATLSSYRETFLATISFETLEILLVSEGEVVPGRILSVFLRGKKRPPLHFQE